MKKRLLSLLLAVLMLTSMLPMVALAGLTATNITVADATYYATGALKSVNTTFNWQQAAVTGRLVLMTERLRSAGEEVMWRRVMSSLHQLRRTLRSDLWPRIADLLRLMG